MADGKNVVRKMIAAGILSPEDAALIGAKSQEARISNVSLKHVHDTRPKIARSVVNVLPDAVSTPSRIGMNVDKDKIVRPGSFVMTKKAGENYSTVLDAKHR